MNPTQIQTLLAPIVAAISGIFAAKFSYFDGATWSALLSGAVSFAAIVWGAFAARTSAIVSTTANLPQVTSVTLDKSVPGTAALDNATPNNVVSK